MMPTQCFKFQGLASRFMNTEFGGHLHFKLVYLTAIQCGCSVSLSFQFRYAAICHGYIIKNIPQVWGYVYCVCFHVLFSLFYILMDSQWELSLTEYPIQSEIVGTTNLYCYNSDSKNKLIYTVGFSLFFVIFGMTLLHSVLNSFRQMKVNEKSICKETIIQQKTVLWNLIILSSVPIIMGVVPLLCEEMFIFFQYLPSAKLGFAIMTLILLNHGTVYGIVILFIFKDYRKAVKKLFLRFIRKEEHESTTTTTVTLFKMDSNYKN